MNQFIVQTLRKFDKITREQVRAILEDAVAEIDRLETVIDSINLGILVCDAAHKILLTNRFARWILNIREFTHGRDFLWQLFYDEAVAEFLHATLAAGDKIEEREFSTEDRRQRRRIISFTVLPLVKLYHVTGTLIIVEDVTKKRDYEAQIHRVEILASLTTLAAGVAHEIKNPLASISIHIQLVQKMLDKARENVPSTESEKIISFDKLKNHLDIATEEVERLNRTVVDFLFAVRPMDLMPINADVNEFVRGIVNLVAVELEERHIDCNVTLAKNLPFAAFDERYLKEAVLNLIKNAIEAMDGGGVLRISTEVFGDNIVLSISDTGKGMSEEEQAKIFEPYWTTKEAGTGLGLTRVFKIVREHRGEIAVSSKTGEGSTFTISLPLPQTGHLLLTGPRG